MKQRFYTRLLSVVVFLAMVSAVQATQWVGGFTD